jgi:hypothetical protein
MLRIKQLVNKLLMRGKICNIVADYKILNKLRKIKKKNVKFN